MGHRDSDIPIVIPNTLLVTNTANTTYINFQKLQHLQIYVFFVHAEIMLHMNLEHPTPYLSTQTSLNVSISTTTMHHELGIQFH